MTRKEIHAAIVETVRMLRENRSDTITCIHLHRYLRELVAEWLGASR